MGGIGAGKSLAAAAFSARGGARIDADALGHEALERPEVRALLFGRWPQVPLLRPDGRIDRRALAAVVFADPAERRALEAMVYPHIARRIEGEIGRADLDPVVRFSVLDAPVIVEAGWDGTCDWLVYVDAPRPLRLARLAARSGWTEADLAAREAAQMPAAEKVRRADAMFANDGDPAALERQVEEWLRARGLWGTPRPAPSDEK